MMDADELKEVLRKHSMWLNDEPGGMRADLSMTNLRLANLRGADLRKANLRWADLSGADLYEADLRWADLSGADLYEADLRWADLSEASGKFVTGYFGKHHAAAAGGYITIGCERHTYQEWLDNGEEIGKANEYTDAEIADYMDWIRLALRALERMEKERE